MISLTLVVLLFASCSLAQSITEPPQENRQDRNRMLYKSWKRKQELNLDDDVEIVTLHNTATVNELEQLNSAEDVGCVDHFCNHVSFLLKGAFILDETRTVKKSILKIPGIAMKKYRKANPGPVRINVYKLSSNNEKTLLLTWDINNGRPKNPKNNVVKLDVTQIMKQVVAESPTELIAASFVVELSSLETEPKTELDARQLRQLVSLSYSPYISVRNVPTEEQRKLMRFLSKSRTTGSSGNTAKSFTNQVDASEKRRLRELENAGESD